MNITGAIFDLDGTLVDSLQVWRVIWNNLGTPVEITGVFRIPPWLADRPRLRF
jgi:phosphoglycolate phosphatase-like HAD superfamily hydrolase